jgi:iron complex outermembrane recepter protein
MTKKVLASAALLATISSFAHAQNVNVSAPSNAQPDSAQSRAVEEIIVTARKRAESIQEVPAAVSTLSGAQLENLGGVTSIKDLASLLPGVALVDTGNINTEINIRGAGAGTARTANVDSPLAILRDGNSISGGNIGGRTFTRADLFDLERVEVIRGPQGSLYGVNAVGGVLNAISRKPGSSLGFSLAADYSDTIGRTAIDAIANIPLLNDRLSVRLGLQNVEKTGGFFFNTFTNSYGDIEEYQGGRLSVRISPTPSIDMLLVYDQSEEVSASNRIKSVNAVNDPTTAVTQRGPVDIDGPFLYAHNTPNQVDRELKSLSLQFSADIPWGVLSSTSGWRKRDTVFQQDEDGSAPGYATAPFPAATCATRSCITIFADKTEMSSSELKFAHAGSGSVDWSIGVNVLNKVTDFATISDGRTTSATVTTPSATANNASANTEEENQWGVYGALTWRIDDRITLDAAVRHSKSEKDFNAFAIQRIGTSPTISCLYLTPFAETNSACIRTPTTIADDFSVTAPTLALKAKITDRLRVFGSVGKGFRAGGFNGNSVLDNGIPSSFTPEETLAFEGGMKFEVAGANATISLFENRFDDLLVTVARIGPDLVSRNYRFNAGKATTRGLDAEVFGRLPIPADYGILSYTLAYNYLTGGINAGPYSGKDVEGSPETTYTLTSNYLKRLSNGMSFGSFISYRGTRGGYTNTVQINNLVRMVDTDLFDGGIFAEVGSVRLTLQAENLTDETYVSLRDPTRDVYGNPRTVSLRLSYKFGSEARQGGRR